MSLVDEKEKIKRELLRHKLERIKAKEKEKSFLNQAKETGFSALKKKLDKM